MRSTPSRPISTASTPSSRRAPTWSASSAVPVFTAEEQVKARRRHPRTRSGISGLTANFLRLVASKRRLFAVPDMIRAFRELVADAKGIVRAQVTLAEKPSEKVLDDIKAALRDVAKAEVEVDVKIDPASSAASS